MLKQLYIRNFTLIDTLDIELKPGFSVITGETGAGKSIILGAIGLLLGQRADAKNIKQGADKCIIEAHFDLSKYSLEVFFENNDIEYDAHDTIIRRELTVPVKAGLLLMIRLYLWLYLRNWVNNWLIFIVSIRIYC